MQLELEDNKKVKNTLLVDEQKEKVTLGKEKNQKETIAKQLTQKEGTLKKQIAQKQAQAKKLDKMIQDIIRKEIQLATEIGDLGIFWDGDERSEAIIARLEAITEGSTYPYTTNKGDDYENCIKFISVEQFNEFIKQC